jgi:Rrf2 family iron-sulfur cluster assembly transcriptional regulator
MSKKVKLTSRGRYAVMAMVELAQKDGKNPVPLAEIAESGSISLSYLEQLFAGLKKNGLVKSYRGPGGGYILAKAANDILVSDILTSAEDCVPAKRSSNDDNPSAYGNPQTQALWGHIGSILYACMSHVSLADVTAQNISEHPQMNKLLEMLG